MSSRTSQRDRAALNGVDASVDICQVVDGIHMAHCGSDDCDRTGIPALLPGPAVRSERRDWVREDRKGTVTEVSSGNPLEGISVCVVNEAEEEIPCEETNASGEYVLEELPAGTYYIEFVAEESDYVTQLYNKKNLLEGPTPKTIAEGEEVEINAEMEKGASIGGTINAPGGGFVGDVEVCALAEYGSSHGVVYFECTEDNVAGDYTLERLPAGEYWIEFYSYQGGYANPQYYPNALSLKAASKVEVTAAGEEKSLNPMELQEGGSISGVVTNASIEKQPIEGVLVCAFYVNGPGESEECELTNQHGEYTIPRLAGGSYEVLFNGGACIVGEGCSEPYEAQLYNGVVSERQATLVSVTAPNTTGGIDASMFETSPKQPANVQAPTLSGTATVGSTLTCSQGSWSNNPTSLSYAWLRNGSAIAGQASSAYTLQSEDEGTTITCEVTVSNAAGAAVATSNAIQVGTGVKVEPKPHTLPLLRKGTAVVSAIKRGHKGSVSIELHCTKHKACKGTVKLLASTVGRVYGSKHQVKRFTHMVLFGSVKFSLAAGAHKTLKLHLTKKGKALLGAPMRRSLKLDVSGTGVKSRKLVLKA